MTEPTSTLVRMMKADEDFESGARNLSSFFKRTEEHWDAGDVLEGLFAPNSDADPKAVEYILFCFLHLGRSDLDTAAGAMKMRRLTLLLSRALRFPRSLGDREREIVERVRSAMNLQNMAHFHKICGDARAWMNALFTRKPVPSQPRETLALLMENEAGALAERLDSVSEKIDPYDLKEMSRILPLITIYEERARSYRLLASAIKSGEEVGKSIISFEYFMKEDEFGKWLKRIGQRANLTKFRDTLLSQREKKIPTRALVGISSLTRCILGDNDCTQLDWVSSALSISGDYRFAVECGGMALHVKKLLGGSTIKLTGTSVQGDYTNEAFAGLTGTDMLTTPLHRPEVDPHDLVCRAINNETILPRLLDNPRVYSRGGLVEHVVRASRSVNVLTKIASTRELHTGAANTGVPVALLRSPCAIPMSLLRGFVNPRYVSTTEMREIVKYGHQVRREVLGEVEGYMNRR